MTIKQKTIIVDIEGGRRVEVRRMRWKAAREFFKKLAVVISALYQGQAADTPIGKAILAKLPDVVSGSDDLIAHICTQSSDLSPEDFDNLDHVSALAVLDAALAVNYDDEVKNCFAEIGRKVAGLVSAKKTS